VLDSEIVSLDNEGKSQFYELLFHRGEACPCGFDLLWCDGEDLRYTALIERKRRLRLLIQQPNRLFYCDHVEQHGKSLFQIACEHDLEGIVAKHKSDPYTPGTKWLKIRNQQYSQWADDTSYSIVNERATPTRSGMPALWFVRMPYEHL
jgi:bifunctional non-homologous end joining protein LigD